MREGWGSIPHASIIFCFCTRSLHRDRKRHCSFGARLLLLSGPHTSAETQSVYVEHLGRILLCKTEFFTLPILPLTSLLPGLPSKTFLVRSAFRQIETVVMRTLFEEASMIPVQSRDSSNTAYLARYGQVYRLNQVNFRHENVSHPLHLDTFFH